MKDILKDLQGQLLNAEGDVTNPAERVELMSQIIVAAIKIKVRAQVIIDTDVEERVGSYGATQRNVTDLEDRALFTDAMGFGESMSAFEDLEMSKRGF
tara:strand:+ start:1350 stop:1643 length:294 start_codon:yes stop_codon:yes gene_type:complete